MSWTPPSGRVTVPTSATLMPLRASWSLARTGGQVFAHAPLHIEAGGFEVSLANW